MTDDLRIVSANIQEGGLDPDGSPARWHQSIEAIRAWSPDVVCLQEMAARRDPLRLREHLWDTANVLGDMFPLLGSEGGISGNHPAILIRGEAGLVILDDGPPPRGPGHDPAWHEALVSPSPEIQLRIYSVHLPPRSAAEQLMHAERLAATVAQRGEHAVIAGDWNSWSPADQLPDGFLETMPPHLRPARTHIQPGKPLAANYDVHRTLAGVGLADAAAGLDPGHRTPPDLTPTGINGGGRVDRFYVTREMRESGAVLSYAQKDGGGSDHEFILLTVSLDAVAKAAAPGFQE